MKITDSVLTVDDLAGRTITEIVMNEDGVYEEIQTALSVEENVFDESESGIPVIVIAAEGICVCALEDTVFENADLTKGVYYGFSEVAGELVYYTKSIPGLTMTKYHQIPVEYVPTTALIVEVTEDKIANATNGMVSAATPPGLENAIRSGRSIVIRAVTGSAETYYTPTAANLFYVDDQKCAVMQVSNGASTDIQSFWFVL